MKNKLQNSQITTPTEIAQQLTMLLQWFQTLIQVHESSHPKKPLREHRWTSENENSKVTIQRFDT